MLNKIVSFLRKKIYPDNVDTTRLRTCFARSTSLLLFLAIVLLYLANGEVLSSGDTLAARFLPISILSELDFDLDEFPMLYDERARRIFQDEEGGLPYFLLYRDGHYLSKFPPGPALAALPVYVLPVLAGMVATSTWLPYLEKLSATLITACSVLFLFWTLRELIAQKAALIISIIYAFGTSSFSVSSQALWQHGPSQCFTSLALYLFVKGIQNDRYVPYACFASTLSVVMRPTNVLIALPLGLYILHKYRYMVMRCIVFSIPPLVFLFFYNYVYFGSIMATGYFPSTRNVVWSFNTPFVEGFLGLLVSPSRGLFIYSPVLVFAIIGIVLIWSKGSLFFRYLSIGPLLVLLFYSKYTWWWGGHSFGPRLLADLLPILCLFLYPFYQKVEGRHVLMGTFLTFGLLSISFHALGAFFYGDSSWAAMLNVDKHIDRLWNWKDSELLYHGRLAYYWAGLPFHRIMHYLAYYLS